MNELDKLDKLDKEIRELLKRIDPMYKPELIRVNISSTFLARTRCVECGKGPTMYYVTHKPYVWKNVRHFIASSKLSRAWIKRFTSDWYMQSSPKFINKIPDFSFALDDKQYRPTLFRTRGEVKHFDNVVELIGCECSATMWAFNQKSTQNRPEITNRKGRYSYPQKFEY